MIDAAAADELEAPAWWQAEIVAHERRTPDVAVVTFRPDQPYPFLAGQYTSLETPWWPRIWRHYSFASAPRSDGLLTFHVKAVPTGWVSTALVHRARRGDVVRLGPPEGSMTVDHTTDPVRDPERLAHLGRCALVVRVRVGERVRPDGSPAQLSEDSGRAVELPELRDGIDANSGACDDERHRVARVHDLRRGGGRVVARQADDRAIGRQVSEQAVDLLDRGLLASRVLRMAGLVDALLDDASTHVRDVRLSVRRGELGALAGVAEPLAADADGLRSFIEEHR